MEYELKRCSKTKEELLLEHFYRLKHRLEREYHRSLELIVDETRAKELVIGFVTKAFGLEYEMTTVPFGRRKSRWHIRYINRSGKTIGHGSVRSAEEAMEAFMESIEHLERQSGPSIILEVFEELSRRPYWNEEALENVHYYVGWRTSKAWKIKKRINIPLSDREERWDSKFHPYGSRIVKKLSDIERALCYLAGERFDELSTAAAIRVAEKRLESTEETEGVVAVQLKYFSVTFCEEDACHLEFTNIEVLNRLNLYAGKKNCWLPPTYGNRYYEEMSPEEQRIVDAFQGKEAYEKEMSTKVFHRSKKISYFREVPEQDEMEELKHLLFDYV